MLTHCDKLFLTKQKTTRQVTASPKKKKTRKNKKSVSLLCSANVYTFVILFLVFLLLHFCHQHTKLCQHACHGSHGSLFFCFFLHHTFVPSYFLILFFFCFVFLPLSFLYWFWLGFFSFFFSTC